MNGKKAKALRKLKYQDKDQRTPYYKTTTRAVSVPYKDQDGKTADHIAHRPQKVCTGLRAEYQKLKKEQKKGDYNA